MDTIFETRLAGNQVSTQVMYEQYWTSIQNEPDKPVWITGSAPTPAELEWARFAAQTPHYVLSSTLSSALWPKTSFVRGLEEIAALKQQPGKDIYLVGGARAAIQITPEY
jgi:hypothetical protein